MDIQRHIDFYCPALWYRSLETQLTAAIDERHDNSVGRTIGRWLLLLVEFIIIPKLFFLLAGLAAAAIQAVSTLTVWIVRRSITLKISTSRRINRSRGHIR